MIQKTAADRLERAMAQRLSRMDDRLSRAGNLLEALSYQATLQRGFAVVKTRNGELVRASAPARSAGELTIQFADGEVEVSTGKARSAPSTPKPSSKKGEQGSLF